MVYISKFNIRFSKFGIQNRNFAEENLINA